MVHFFLEYAGELHIITLRIEEGFFSTKKKRIEEGLKSHTHTHARARS